MSSDPNVVGAPSPNFTLDPQGIRGTSSARRLRQSRRRRQLQTLFVALFLLAGVAALGWFYAQPRATGFAVARAQTLPLDLRAPASLDVQGSLWIISASGALWRIGAEGAPKDYGVATTAGAPPFISAGGGVYVPGLDGTLTAFSAPGPARWTRDLGAAIAATPALWRAGALKVLAAGDSDGRIFGLNANDGKTVWSAQLGGPIGHALVATRDSFLAPTLASGAWRGGLVCLDARTGRVKWRFPTGARAGAGVAAPVPEDANGRVYWNNDEGDIACLDAASGSVIWQSAAASLQSESATAVTLRAAPILSGENLIVGGNDGALRALQARDGKPLWTKRLGAPIRALYSANAGGVPALLAVSGREIVLLDAAKGEIIGSDTGDMAWPTSGGQGAIITGASGSWRRVNWHRP